jgi:photosystem II stability/assembly factor-like uncharacterized protein
MKQFPRSILILLAGIFLATPTVAQEEDTGPQLNSSLFSGLKLRNIGPAFMSGRVVEIAVDPVKRSTWYVAAASGGVWKTVNAGTTWQPIFDSYGSYSIGTVVVDPNDRHTVWVGTGENNSQRSVGYGDGLYKSTDGGRGFKKVGLENSEHIARVIVDPRNSDVVYVAAQGPLWSAGGDRGVYKTTDGGSTWEQVLAIDEHTGVSDLVYDPRNPDVLYAAAYQRRRHVWTLINGGPGSGIYKTTDGGATWNEINSGLPSGDKGRIGLAISPIDPDVLYAIVEAALGEGGLYRSTNAGGNWSRQGDYVSGSPQYYQEIYADPHKFDRLYSMDTYAQVSEDGGKTWSGLGEEWKHVDNHALWIDPDDAEHLLIGTDGGIYQTWDRGRSWDFFSNLSLSQYYKVAVDNAEPFYNIYGGTQDNATHGGPSRTTNVHGIRNADWFVTVFGDGFDPAVDPDNPNIVYSQWQYGGLVRFDRQTGEQVDIKPQAGPDGPPLRWNWDSALLISPHSASRIYFASQILFRSDDRGDTWRAVSPDLSRNIDRNQLEVMGRVWSVDAVSKNRSTSVYGNIVALTESPLVEGLLYTGSDDGLVQVSEDGGESWQRIDRVGEVPEMTYVNDLEASLHDPNTVYAVFNNHKRGDFAPYVYKSTNRGGSWENITSDLPERGSTYTIVQDHVNPNLLFVGTEFGLYATLNEGDSWIELTGGMPTIGVRELEIQRRENDLAVASFGRGFYILDDYTPLRDLSEELIAGDAHMFTVKRAWLYIQDAPLGLDGKAMMGGSYYTADNPPFGATFSYYLKESLQTREAQRREQEKELQKEGQDTRYPTWDALRAEAQEEDPGVWLVVRDGAGNVVRRVKGSSSKGIHRTTWDLRYPGYSPVSASGNTGQGPLALPGRYTVSLEQRVDGVTTQLVGPTDFDVEVLGAPTLMAADRDALLAFHRDVGELWRVVMGASQAAGDAARRLELMKRAIEATPSLGPDTYERARALELRLAEIQQAFTGDRVLARAQEPTMPGIMGRLQQVLGNAYASTSRPTTTHRRNVEIAGQEFEGILADLQQLVEVDIPALEDDLEAAGAPWTPGRRIPRWTRN